MACSPLRWLARPLARSPVNGLIAALLVVSVGEAAARGPVEAPPVIGRAEVPAEVRDTERLVLSGGPFPFPKDGTTFGNRERLLPPNARGYYREYTVPTPGARNRGARRLVCGGVQPRLPDACYYTADHYASFKRLTP